MSEPEVFEHLALARRAERRRGFRALLPRRRDVRPLRAGDRRRDPLALGVPDALHAVPARGLAGRPAGDVRVPDLHVGADRAAGLERVDVRGPLVGRVGRLPRAGRAEGAHAGSSSPAASTRTAAQTLDDLRPRLRRQGRRGRARDGLTERRRARSDYVDQDVAAIFVQNPNFLGGVEDLEALAAAAHEAGALAIASVDPMTLGVLRPPGECRDRRRGRRGPAARRTARLRRPVVRLLLRDRGAPPPHARPDRRRDDRRRRPARLRPRAADARAAHPPREGDPQHLHLAGADRARRRDPPGLARQARPGRARRAHGPAHRLRARDACRDRRRRAAPRRAGLPRVRDHGRRARSRRCSTAAPPTASPPATRSAATTPSTRTACSSRSPSAARRRTSTGSPTRSSRAVAATRATHRETAEVSA